MKPPLYPCFVSVTVTFGVAAALAQAGCQTNDPPAAQPPALPSALQATAQETWVATVSARGVQIYECRDVDGKPAWTFVAPEAELFDGRGRRFGHHGAGPIWQAEDGSSVVGKVVARADAPISGAVPWLLLETRSAGRPGALAKVTRIRRVHTAGGVAPGSGCDTGGIGSQRRVAYSADYALYEGR